MVTIITPLRGDPSLSARWAGAVADRRIEATVIATVNNQADETIVEGMHGVAIPVDKYPGTDEVERVLFIASLYSTLLQQVKTDRVLLLDDDVVPPFRGFLRLLETADAKLGRGVAGIVTVYPYNDSSTSQANLFWRPFDRAGIGMAGVPIMGVHKVWGGGTGFSIWKTEVLLKTLPWTTEDLGDGDVPGWDRDLAIKLGEMKAQTLCDCAIRSRHDNLP